MEVKNKTNTNLLEQLDILAETYFGSFQMANLRPILSIMLISSTPYGDADFKVIATSLDLSLSLNQ